MKKNNVVHQISIAGMLCALGILLGSFGAIKILGGSIYLCAIPIFLTPMFLRIEFSLMTTLATILMVDLISGWIAFTWISLVAYMGSVLIINFYPNNKKQINYYASIMIACAYAIVVYFFLEWIAFDFAYALKDLVYTSIQFAICIPVIILLYPVAKKLNYV